MGIRFEKDTILNWINEMGKFLRLLVDKWETAVTDVDQSEIDVGYNDFFKQNREVILGFDDAELQAFVEQELQDEQVRPLAQLLMYDGLLNNNTDLLKKAKFLFDYHATKTGTFSFEDLSSLSTIDQHLNIK